MTEGALHDEFVNAILLNTPEHYDGDCSGEAIAIQYVRDLEDVLNTARVVVEVLACLHVHDPECARCGWMKPFREAVWTAIGTWPDEDDVDDSPRERFYESQFIAGRCVTGRTHATVQGQAECPDCYSAERCDRLPVAPAGFATLNTGVGVDRHQQANHLVRRGPKGGTPGPTLCGLTRFDERDPVTYAVVRPADIAGWSVGGGVSGPSIEQVRCVACWSMAESEAAERGATATVGSDPLGPECPP